MSSGSKELNLHRNEVGVLAQLDGLLTEGGGHDEDVLGGALEVDFKCNCLLLVELEEGDWLEVSQRSCILYTLLFPRFVLRELEVAENVGDLEGLKRVAQEDEAFTTRVHSSLCVLWHA